jgi:hypothetical protein
VHLTRIRPCFNKALFSSKQPLLAMYRSSSPFSTHTFNPISPPPQGMEPAAFRLCEFQVILYVGKTACAGITSGNRLQMKIPVSSSRFFVFMDCLQFDAPAPEFYRVNIEPGISECKYLAVNSTVIPYERKK